MTILDGVGIREGIIKDEQPEPVKAEEGSIVFHAHQTGVLVGDGSVMHQGAFVGSAAALSRFTMQRTPSGGWVVSEGSGALIGAFSSFDEAVGWLKQKVAK